MNWYVQAFQKYANFNGRSRRSEYWYFVLINTLIVWGIILIEFVLKTYGILAAVYAIGAIVPSFAVTVRRLHDTGRSGWNILPVGVNPHCRWSDRAHLSATGQPSGRESIWGVGKREIEANCKWMENKNII